MEKQFPFAKRMRPMDSGMRFPIAAGMFIPSASPALRRRNGVLTVNERMTFCSIERLQSGK